MNEHYKPTKYIDQRNNNIVSFTIYTWINY